MSQTFASSTLSRWRSMEVGPIFVGGSTMSRPHWMAHSMSRSDRNIFGGLLGPVFQLRWFNRDGLPVRNGYTDEVALTAYYAGRHVPVDRFPLCGFIRPQPVALFVPAVDAGGCTHVLLVPGEGDGED